MLLSRRNSNYNFQAIYRRNNIREYPPGAHPGATPLGQGLIIIRVKMGQDKFSGPGLLCQPRRGFRIKMGPAVILLPGAQRAFSDQHIRATP